MASENLVILIGNLGSDPKIRQTQTGKRVANFSVATTKKFKDKTETTWHFVVSWLSVDYLEKCAKKGSTIYLRGEIINRKWTDKNGNDAYKTEIVAGDVKILNNRGDNSQTKTENKNQVDDFEDDFSEIPF